MHVDLIADTRTLLQRTMRVQRHCRTTQGVRLSQVSRERRLLLFAQHSCSRSIISPWVRSTVTPYTHQSHALVLLFCSLCVCGCCAVAIFASYGSHSTICLAQAQHTNMHPPLPTCYPAMKGLITAARPFLSGISKAKGGKLFRVLLDNFLEIDAAVEEQVATTVECIEWTTQAKRRFLKQALEIVLTRLHLKARQFREALQVISLSLSLSLSLLLSLLPTSTSTTPHLRNLPSPTFVHFMGSQVAHPHDNPIRL